MRGDSVAVRRLLTQKADVNAPQADGATALHWAVYRDDLATVDLLLKSRCQREGGQQLRRDAAVTGRGERQPGHRAALARRRSGRERAHAQQRHRAHDGGADRQRRDDDAAARSRRRREREGNSAGHDGVDVGGGSAASGGRPAARRPRSGRRRGLEPCLAGPARELRQGRRSETVEEAGSSISVSQIGPRNMRDQEAAGSLRWCSRFARTIWSRCAFCSRPAPT